jgi:hypothetical protein
MKEIKDLLRKLEPMLGKTSKALWYNQILSKDAKAHFKNLEFLRLLADRKAFFDFRDNIRLPPPSPDKLAGKYSLGQVLYPVSEYAQFGLNGSDFIKHILIVGITGAGKTNLAFHILRQLNESNIPFLVFDWKRNYQALKQLPGFDDIKIIRLGTKECNLRFNPLIPPKGVDPKNWMAILIDVIKHAFFVGHGVEYFFRKGIDYLYEQFGVYQGSQEYPTFADLEKVLQKEFVRGREMLWMSSAKRALATLTFSGLLGEMINVRENHDLDSILSQKVILEMDNLATIEKIFLVESLLLWIYHVRKSDPRREEFKHAIIIEEAHHVLSGKKELGFGEETIIESIIRMVREFGEGVIAIDQEPCKLSNSILANTNCKICFNLGNGKDIITMARAMSLKEEEQRAIDKLKVGHAIVKMKERFHEPIHVRFPLVPINKSLIGTP